MSMTLEAISREAFCLPKKERELLAEQLWQSVEPEKKSGAKGAFDWDEAWEPEIRKRVRRLDSGEEKSTPAAKVFSRLRGKR